MLFGLEMTWIIMIAVSAFLIVSACFVVTMIWLCRSTSSNQEATSACKQPPIMKIPFEFLNKSNMNCACYWETKTTSFLYNNNNKNKPKIIIAAVNNHHHTNGTNKTTTINRNASDTTYTMTGNLQHPTRHTAFSIQIIIFVSVKLLMTSMRPLLICHMLIN